MKAIVCVDKNNGTMFNNRRQSMDSMLRKYLLNIIGDNLLFLSEYSAKQFENQEKLKIDNDFFNKVGAEDYCFIEGQDILMDRIEELYIFNWNRVYPADKYFDIKELTLKYKKVKIQNFKGSSHDKITLKIYKRKD